MKEERTQRTHTPTNPSDGAPLTIPAGIIAYWVESLMSTPHGTFETRRTTLIRLTSS